MLNISVGQRIKDRRKELGISADKLAEILHVSRSTVFRYENGDIEKLPADALEPIASALHTTVAALMGWDEPPTVVPPLPSEFEILARGGQNLTPEQRDVIVRYALYMYPDAFKE